MLFLKYRFLQVVLFYIYKTFIHSENIFSSLEFKFKMSEEEMIVVPAEIAEADYTDKGNYEKLCERVNPIAFPLASRKQTKKIYKLIKKAAALNEKEYLRHGLSDVQKALRKDEKGLVVLAGKFVLQEFFIKDDNLPISENLVFLIFLIF